MKKFFVRLGALVIFGLFSIILFTAMFLFHLLAPIYTKMEDLMILFLPRQNKWKKKIRERQAKRRKGIQKYRETERFWKQSGGR